MRHVPIDRDKIVQAAQAHIERQRYDQAIVEYQRLVREDPNDTRTLLKIGDLQARIRAFPEAIATYDRVGKYYLDQGFSLKAIAVCKQIREIIRKHAPDQAERYAHIGPRLAEIYTKLGLTSDALAAWDEVAIFLQRAGRDRDAVEVFRKMVELEPGNPLPHLRLAEACCRLQALDPAIESFWTAAELLLSLGRKDDSLKVVERILHFRADARFARVAAELYLERGTREDALQALAKLQICFQADPRNLETLELLARAFVAIGQEQKAIEVHKEIARLAKDLGRADLYLKALTHLRAVAPHDEQVRAFESLAPPAQPEPVARPITESIPELSADLLESELPPESAIKTTGLPRRPFTSAPEVAIEGPEPRGWEGQRAPASGSAHTRKAIADAESFRKLRLYPKAIGALRFGLEFEPQSLELRTKLRELLLEAGQRDEMILESINVATLHLERQEIEQASFFIREVLSFQPDHEEALSLLELVAPDEAIELRAKQSLSPPAAAPSSTPPMDAGESESHRPLPSYDLEGVTADQAMSSAPPAEGTTGARSEAPLPSFSMEMQEPRPLSQIPTFGEIEELDEVDGVEEIEPTTQEAVSDPTALEEALEEAEFFAARGLFEDALGSLREQLGRTPKNRLLLDKIREIAELSVRGASRAVDRALLTSKQPSLNVARSLEALDGVDAPASGATTGGAVDAEQVYAKFKANVGTEVAESDSATHYDLAVAYKEMGLIPDALKEFEIAKRDPQRECTCCAMIGMIHRDQDRIDLAVEAYTQALNAEHRTQEQERDVCYEMGRLLERQGQTSEAIGYFERAAHRDPEYRDVQDRIRSLSQPPPPNAEGSGTRSVGEDDDVERAFDDLFESS